MFSPQTLKILLVILSCFGLLVCANMLVAVPSAESLRLLPFFTVHVLHSLGLPGMLEHGGRCGCAKRSRRDFARSGRHCKPEVCFLDVQMPGMTGIEAARHIGPRAQMVFVTAYDRYALEAFEHGVLDYLVKPVSEARLANTVTRLQARLAAAEQSAPSDALLREMAQRLSRLEGSPGTEYLRWLRTSKGGALHLIPLQDVDFLRADSKYTLVGYRDDSGKPAEALIRLALKELVAQLDPSVFVQVHRAVVVNLGAIKRVLREDRDSAVIELKHRQDRLPVSKTHLHLFREM
jgi:DNA-binding LytR/AlgR family response regulator